MTTSILWFSRHSMTESQLAALSSKLGKITVTQVDGTMPNVHVPFKAKTNGGEEVEVPPFKELIKEFEVLAVVAPINLQQQILSVSGEKPVIIAQSNRVRVSTPEGEEPKFEFEFAGWHKLVKIEVITEEFAS